jgi:hypothetical protein
MVKFIWALAKVEMTYASLIQLFNEYFWNRHHMKETSDGMANLGWLGDPLFRTAYAALKQKIMKLRITRTSIRK